MGTEASSPAAGAHRAEDGEVKSFDAEVALAESAALAGGHFDTIEDLRAATFSSLPRASFTTRTILENAIRCIAMAGEYRDPDVPPVPSIACVAATLLDEVIKAPDVHAGMSPETFRSLCKAAFNMCYNARAVFVSTRQYKTHPLADTVMLWLFLAGTFLEPMVLSQEGRDKDARDAEVRAWGHVEAIFGRAQTDEVRAASVVCANFNPSTVLSLARRVKSAEAVAEAENEGIHTRHEAALAEEEEAREESGGEDDDE